MNAINEAIGANGTTINFASPIETHQGVDADMETLVADMNGGKVGALIVYGVNPAYEYYNAKAFTDGVKKVNSLFPLTNVSMKLLKLQRTSSLLTTSLKAGEMQNQKLVSSPCCNQLSTLFLPKHASSRIAS